MCSHFPIIYLPCIWMCAQIPPEASLGTVSSPLLSSGTTPSCIPCEPSTAAPSPRPSGSAWDCGSCRCSSPPPLLLCRSGTHPYTQLHNNEAKNTLRKHTYAQPDLFTLKNSRQPPLSAINTLPAILKCILTPSHLNIHASISTSEKPSIESGTSLYF